MNFLSHYYLDRCDNLFFTIGLTLPDVIGLHNNNVGLKNKTIDLLLSSTTNIHIKDMLNGMKIHFFIDKQFHSSAFFKENIAFLQEKYNIVTGGDDIAFFYVHILLEILIDRFLLIKHPTIVDEFYNDYKKFDFNNISDTFLDVKNFEKQKFLDFTKLFSNSNFLYGYKDKYSVLESLQKVTKRIGLPIEFNHKQEVIANYIDLSYNLLEQKIDDFFLFFKKSISAFRYNNDISDIISI